MLGLKSLAPIGATPYHQDVDRIGAARRGLLVVFRAVQEEGRLGIMSDNSREVDVAANELERQIDIAAAPEKTALQGQTEFGDEEAEFYSDELWKYD